LYKLAVFGPPLFFAFVANDARDGSEAVINRWLKQYHRTRPHQALKRKPLATTLTMRLLQKRRAINAWRQVETTNFAQRRPKPKLSRQKRVPFLRPARLLILDQIMFFGLFRATPMKHDQI
jgi:hypothetical protein